MALEQIVCGREQPVAIAAVRRRAKYEAWREDDGAYLDEFWRVVDALTAAEKIRSALLEGHNCLRGRVYFRAMTTRRP